MPDATVEIAWATPPLEEPAFTDVSDYVRRISTERGRNFEFDRTEAGRLGMVLSNRERDFDPSNTGGAFYPNVKPTRRTRASAVWNGTVYAILEGFTQGFPQDYPNEGHDAVVQQTAVDWFYPLNTLKFGGATTTLAAAITTTDMTTITVVSSALPLPQAFPFTIQVGTPPDTETMEVTGSPSAGQWTVDRAHDGTVARTFVAGSLVRSDAVRFAQELSGTRINNCLDLLGVSALDRDIDPGNTLLAASVDLAGQSILEHLLLVAECENGRLFAAKDGTITFRQRHRLFTEELESTATFGSGDGEIPYLAAGVQLAHDDAKLYNHIRITIADGTVVEAEDTDSIEDHFRRTLDKQWPLASENEAKDAADWMLTRLARTQLRLPRITVTPTPSNGLNIWPVLLDAELGRRYHIVLDPPVAGGDVIDTDVVVEAIGHARNPGRWDVSFELSEADAVLYWRLGVAGASELDETTIPAY